MEHIFKNTKINEVQTWILYQLEALKKEELILYKRYISSFVEYCDNWWISDGLSSVYAKILEEDKKFLETLSQWNKDSNLWKRRQSVVSLFYYARQRKVHQKFEESITLIENLLHDKEYYVQK